MRKALNIILFALLFCLYGCSEVPKALEIQTEPIEIKIMSENDSENVIRETDVPETGTDTSPAKETDIVSETQSTAVYDTEPILILNESDSTYQEEIPICAGSTTAFSFESAPLSSESEETKVYLPVPETKSIKETETPEVIVSSDTAAITDAPKETEPPIPQTETESESVPEMPFDIDYWISYAQSTAVSKGLTLESSAVECWDNPITANPDCIYLERDISSRMSRYEKDEDISDVWIWYECVGADSYLIYVGYA